jgi:hypothetical protein
VHVLLRRDVGSASLDGEYQPVGAQDVDGMQDGVAADVVAVLQLLDRRKRTGAPLARRDPGAQDPGQLLIGRHRGAMINRHTFNVDQSRAEPTSR